MSKAIIQGGSGLNIKNAIRWKAKSADEDLNAHNYVDTEMEPDFWIPNVSIGVNRECAILCGDNEIIAQVYITTGTTYIELLDRKTFETKSTTVISSSISSNDRYQLFKQDETHLFLLSISFIIPLTILPNYVVTVGSQTKLDLSGDIGNVQVRENYAHFCLFQKIGNYVYAYLYKLNLNNVSDLASIQLKSVYSRVGSYQASSLYSSFDFVTSSRMIVHIYLSGSDYYTFLVDESSSAFTIVSEQMNLILNYGLVKYLGNSKALVVAPNKVVLLSITNNSITKLSETVKDTTFWSPDSLRIISATDNSNKWAVAISKSSTQAETYTPTQNYVVCFIVNITNNQVSLENENSFNYNSYKFFVYSNNLTFFNNYGEYMELDLSYGFTPIKNALYTNISQKDNICILSKTKGLYSDNSDKIGTFTIHDNGSIMLDNNEITVTKGSSVQYFWKMTDSMAIGYINYSCNLVEVDSNNKITVTKLNSPADYYSNFWRVNDSTFIAVTTSSAYLVVGKFDYANKKITHTSAKTLSNNINNFELVKLTDTKLLYKDNYEFGIATLNSDNTLVFKKYDNAPVTSGLLSLSRVSKRICAVYLSGRRVLRILLTENLLDIQDIKLLGEYKSLSDYQWNERKMGNKNVAPYAFGVMLSSQSGSTGNNLKYLNIVEVKANNATIKSFKASCTSNNHMYYIDGERYLLFAQDLKAMSILNINMLLTKGSSALLTTKATKNQKGTIWIGGGVDKDDYTFD
nr:MAG TPA: hypothetical protein [Caudoviricetes sp.]